MAIWNPFAPGPRFSSVKHPRHYDIDTKLPYVDILDRYLIDDFGGTHAFYEVIAPAADVATKEQIIRVRESLCGIYRQTPPDITQFQFEQTGTGNYRDVILEHASYRSPWPIADYLRQKRVESLFLQQKHRRLVRGASVFVMSCRPRGDESQRNELWEQLVSAGIMTERLERRLLNEVEFESAVHTLSIGQAAVEDSFRLAGINLVPMPPEKIASYFYTLFNPDLAFDLGIPCNYSYDRDAFYDAWLCSETELLPNYLKWGDYYHGWVSINKKPEQTLPRDIERISKGLGFPEYHISLKLRKLDQEKERAKLRFRLPSIAGRLKEGIGSSPIMTYGNKTAQPPVMQDPELKAEAIELEDLLVTLRSGEETLVSAQFTIHIWHREIRELDRRRQILATRIADLNNARPWIERRETMPVMLSSLPGAFAPLQRDIKIPSRMAADLCPIHKGFEGVGKPCALFRNNTGGLVSFDLFDRTSIDAPLAFVTGDKGSGKSFLVIQLILQHLVSPKESFMEKDLSLFAIEKGDSYETLFKLLGGYVMALDKRNPMCFNPLQVSGLYHNNIMLAEPPAEVLQRIKANLTPMLLKPEDEEALHNTLMRMVEQAILKTSQQGKQVVTTSILAKFMSEHIDEPGARLLSERIIPFTLSGPYGQWVDGPTAFDPKSNAIYFNLRGLGDDEMLHRAIIPNIVNTVSNVIYSNPARRKLVVMDEFWTFLDNVFLTSLAINAWKTWRKENACVIGASQSLQDLAKNKSICDAIIQCTDTWCLLEQGKDEQRQKAVQLLDLTAGQADILSHLDQMQATAQSTESWRECLMLIGKGKKSQSGRVRVQVSPEEFWLGATQPEEKALRQEVLDQYEGDVVRAIEFLAREHPYGPKKTMTKV